METSKVLRDMASELSKSMKPESLPLITAETSSAYVHKRVTKEQKKPVLKKNSKSAALLKAGYTKEKRMFEITMMVSFVILQLTIMTLVTYHFKRQYFGAFIMSLVFGALLADFMSGLVHWAADTWGTVNIPIIGQAFIRPFREHHVDPVAMTKHDIVETNGDNCMLSNLFLVPLLSCCYLYGEEWMLQNFSLLVFGATFTIYVCLTNQIHKWSHMISGVPKWVKVLQDAHIIMPRPHHHIHHISPHETYFCITGGWLNYPLEKIQFFQTLEFIIEALTAHKPRSDDQKWLKG
ncbi:plasmanylethanolamine desaturase 1-like [Bolinopsis microptera]|uniref:plasmanylethanolamine desaturase 1-like n=1 Tax=Bolinopsis microptera TaxID=2820187 RepID=UPI00307AAA1B